MITWTYTHTNDIQLSPWHSTGPLAFSCALLNKFSFWGGWSSSRSWNETLLPEFARIVPGWHVITSNLKKIRSISSWVGPVLINHIICSYYGALFNLGILGPGLTLFLAGFGNLENNCFEIPGFLGNMIVFGWECGHWREDDGHRSPGHWKMDHGPWMKNVENVPFRDLANLESTSVGAKSSLTLQISEYVSPKFQSGYGVSSVVFLMYFYVIFSDEKQTGLLSQQLHTIESVSCKTDVETWRDDPGNNPQTVMPSRHWRAGISS